MTNKNIDNIKNYANEIVTLESFVEAVRQMPGMYIGPLSNAGFLNMFREIFQNSLDELIKAAINLSPCNFIRVTYDESSNTVIVEDNGRGIPFGHIIRIFTSEHTSSNYKKNKGEYSSGRHGVGSKVVNALATEFIVESYILGEARRVEFRDMIPWEFGEKVIPNTENKQGTRITFRPCYDVMGKINITVTDIIAYIKTIFPLTPVNSKMHFTGIHKDGTVYEEDIINADGIISYLIMSTTSPIIKPIVLFNDTGEMKAEIAFTYDSNDLQAEHIVSFSNYCPTVSGTHVDGFIEGVCKFFREYMNKIYLSGNKNKKLSVVSNDIKTGLKAVVNVCHLEPNFTGQAKEILSNEDMFYFVRDLMVSSLDEWTKNNPNDLQKICKYLKDIAEIRLSADKEKVKLTSKYNSVLTGLPQKYIKPLTKKGVELIIVEGDSAGGGYRNERHETQGILPIRGKMPNAFTTTKEKFLANEEVKAILTILGTGYGRNCNPANSNVEKIILTPDADADGAHIRTLLLGLFLIHLTPLIEAGMVYAAVPPLFTIQKGNKNIYFVDRLDFVEYVQKLFSKQNTISTIKGVKLSDKEIISIIYNNGDYTYDMDVVSNRFAIDINLLETILINKNASIESLRDIIKQQYRFLDITKKNNTYILEGLLNSKYQTVFFNDQFMTDINKLYNTYIKNNQYMYYNINGEIKSLYNMMSLFQSTTPSGLTRNKGLGEMNPEQLAESTLYPSDNRVLIKYTMESASNEIERLKYLESNKSEFIKNIKVSRTELIG